ncbi:DUF87 domain-containing protein [Salarchaeum sp. III]|uniref:helicase HerA domain-containing protein n=1 Tax=Salarchaeum sp. III TaxID=3107927 RepID=UPI002ED98B72
MEPASTDEEHIHVGETADGAAVELPTVDILTGRAFLTGKSGSGKSNTASVVIEELLDAGFPVLIVDCEGEYYGLKEEFELLHAGADEECDIQVGPEHAEKLASLALEQNVPVILDVSGFLDEDASDELVRETARQLFVKEKKLKKPFLLVVEEVHEYIPEGAGMGETGRMLIKVGKRGRKHGLGVMGISQRPADVKKDFITQANWLVWHRLTWENDTKVVGRIVGSEYGEQVSELDAGEAFVQADWTDDAVSRIQFKRKRTFDAGATPGLDDFERPELKSVSEGLMDDLASISEREEREADRIAELEEELAAKRERINELEEELRSARNVSMAARQMANVLTAEGVQTTLPTDADEDVEALRAKVERLEDALNEEEPESYDIEEIQEKFKERGEELADEKAVETPSGDGEADDGGRSERVDALLESPSVRVRVEAAIRESQCNEERARRLLDELDGERTAHDLCEAASLPIGDAQSLLDALRSRRLVTRNADREYAFDGEELRRLARGDDPRGAVSELSDQWRFE